MKRQQLNQSKIRIRTDSLGSDLLEDQLEIENPQNNFQKILNIHPDIPGRELRNMIQSMSQHCTFQKNIIKKTANVEVPRYVRSQIKRKEVYEDYLVVKNYAIFSGNKRHFQERKIKIQSRPNSNNSNAQQERRKKSTSSMMQAANRISNKKGKNMKNINQGYRIINQASKVKPTTLLQFVQAKKNKLLMQDNILKVEQNNVANILNDNKKRQKIFEEALFLERLYDIQIQKLKKVGVSQNGAQVPEKFRGIQPKHIRISSQACRNQEQFLRKKYVCKKRKLQFYGHARKIEQSSLKTKKKQNIGVLATLIKYNQTHNNHPEPNQTFITSFSKNKQQNAIDQDLKIQKLFLRYSCSQADNPEQLYKYMGEDEVNLFLQNFNLEQKKLTNLQLKSFLQKKKQQNNKQSKQMGRPIKIKYFLFDFLEILYILASQNSTDKLCCNIHDFLNSYIWPKEQKVIPQSWLKLKKIKKSQKIAKFLRIIKFQQKAGDLFKKKISKCIVNQFQVPLLNFNDILQMAWQLKLFPLQITKKSLRFIYLYCRSYENGVCQADFIDLLIITGLKFGPQSAETQEKLRWIINHIAI